MMRVRVQNSLLSAFALLLVLSWGCSSNPPVDLKSIREDIANDMKTQLDAHHEVIEKDRERLAGDFEELQKTVQAKLDRVAQGVHDKLTDDRDIKDEAMLAGLTRADFPLSDPSKPLIDAFKGMDRQPEGFEYKFEPKGIMGRNSWIAWNAGNQRMWDFAARNTFGLIDLLKVVDTRNRGERFKTMGLINEPGMVSADAAEGDVVTNPFGVRLDIPSDPERRKMLYDETNGLYRTEGLDPKVYGYSSGVMGFRLFPNPEFFEKSANQADWDSRRYYNSPIYFESPNLIRPYRVGMTCGICHVAFNPIFPPDDPEAPKWENLSASIGNQYFREGLAFGHNITLQDSHEDNFYWQALNMQPAGTSDTSRVASDHINGPTAINAIFRLPERLDIAVNEKMGPGAKLLPPPADANGLRPVPHILRDGADSVGVGGATIRVYVNIGLFSEYWLKRHNPGLGLFPQKPFEIEVAQKNSVYWQATEDRLEATKTYLSYDWEMGLKHAKMKDGTTGQEYIDKQPGDLERGKIVFAEKCARCHSSKGPPAGTDRDGEAGTAWFVAEVKKDEFWKDNFLSEDRRHKVTEEKLGTNASRAMGSNAAAGHIWDNCSSETYKQLPSVGVIHGGWPDTDEWKDYQQFNKQCEFVAPGGGRGYYRTPSLVAIWATAPYLASNAVGKFTGDPSVEGRLEAFHDGIEKLLGLKPRDNVVWKTDRETYLILPGGIFPAELREKAALLGQKLGNLTGAGAVDLQLVEVDERGTPQVKLGPIPAGTTVNLLLNLDFSVGNTEQIASLLLAVKRELLEIKLHNMSSEEAHQHMRQKLVPLLLQNNLCPDFVMDKGHTFGQDLSEDDRRSLIKLLLTL